MITTIVVDDDQHSLDNLTRMLELKYYDIQIVATPSNIKDAEKAINNLKPDLVFLDIELGTNQLAFDLLKKINPVSFEVVFTTAYNKYALSAIKSCAIDYLLKPVDEEELKIAIEKFKNRKSSTTNGKIENLLAAWANPDNQQNKISLPTMTGFDLIKVADIVSCEGIRSQTLIVLVDKKEILISRMLWECEELLLPFRFCRIHKSYLINLSHVKSFIKGQDGTVIMSNGKNFNVSRNFKDQFIDKVNGQRFL